MTKPWRPERKIIEGPWTQAAAYRVSRRARPVWIGTLVLGAVFAGLVGAAGWQHWDAGSRQPVDTSAIEWNAVQAVPTRTPDAEDIAWQQRAQLQPSPSWGGLRGGDRGFPSPADAAGPPPSSSPTRGEGGNDIYVIDGDTFAFGGQRIRIAGIDAPETHPPRCIEEARLGLAATEKLKQLLASGTVTISGSGHDQYGRELREVRVNGRDVGEAMISAGLARSYAGEKRQGWCD